MDRHRREKAELAGIRIGLSELDQMDFRIFQQPRNVGRVDAGDKKRGVNFPLFQRRGSRISTEARLFRRIDLNPVRFEKLRRHHARAASLRTHGNSHPQQLRQSIHNIGAAIEDP